MQKTDDNFKFCSELVARFDTARQRPTGKEAERIQEMLCDTLLDACSSPQVAEEVAKAVARREEFYPSEATIRKYVRERYIEADVQAEYAERIRDEISRKKGELA